MTALITCGMKRLQNFTARYLGIPIDAGVSVGRIIYADISDEEKENIAYGNAARLIENCSFFKGRRVMPV